MKIHREQTIKAHVTEYKDLLFRSKLEVRWAYLFDQLGLSWSYETKAYRLSPSRILPNGCGYIPDFDLGFAIAEVKPDEPTAEEIAKALGVLGYEKKPFIFLIGRPSEGRATIIYLSKAGFRNVSFKELPINEALNVSNTDYRKALVKTNKIVFVPKKRGH